MTKERNVNSKRSKRRAERDFKGSRPERRAKRRLNWAMGAYNPGDNSCTQPGSKKHW